MRTVCIVQARMGSTRLPGKVLLPLSGGTVLREVLRRCQEVPQIDDVVCAVPHGEIDDPVAREAGKIAHVVRGPETDVLARYLLAAEETRADVVLRVTSDCPHISPGVCGLVVDAVARGGADYACNNAPRTWPHGLDCEAFTIDVLRRANVEAGPGEREHVTTWMRRAVIKRINVRNPWPCDGRLTLDTEDDYRVICAAFGHEPYQHLRAA